MRQNIDPRKLKSRKRLWDIFRWGYKHVNSLSKTHSLNCGCSECRYRTFERRLSNKRERLLSRKNLRDTETN